MRNSTKTMMLSLPELSNAELAHMLVGHHGLDERSAEFVHEHEHERARDDATRQHDERADPRPVYHAGGDSDHLARNEGDDDLKKLDGEQDEETHGTCLAHIVDDAVEPAGLEDLVNVRPDERAEQDHDAEEGDEARELQDVGERRLAPANRRLRVHALAARRTLRIRREIAGRRRGPGARVGPPCGVRGVHGVHDVDGAILFIHFAGPTHDAPCHIPP